MMLPWIDKIHASSRLVPHTAVQKIQAVRST